MACCSTDNMLADVMTKGLTEDESEKFRRLLNIHPIN